MIIRKRLSLRAGLVAMLILAPLGAAHAQSCGDSDSSGSVTVTDGVNVLRHTASLSSACTNNSTRCDSARQGVRLGGILVRVKVD